MKDNAGKVLLALLAGASAGIVAGLLLAPEAGSETRDSLGKSLGKFGDDLNKLLQEGLTKFDELKGGAKDSAGDDADRSGAEDALAGLGSSGKSSKRSNAGSSATDAGTSSGAGGSTTASSSRSNASEEEAGSITGGSGVGS